MDKSYFLEAVPRVVLFVYCILADLPVYPVTGTADLYTRGQPDRGQYSHIFVVLCRGFDEEEVIEVIMEDTSAVMTEIGFVRCTVVQCTSRMKPLGRRKVMYRSMSTITTFESHSLIG